MMVTKTLRIPVELELKIAARVKKNGTNNESEVIRDMIERGLSEEGKL
jgi:Arc/MetJ-type ribon-helix-helix transcriptional regulator